MPWHAMTCHDMTSNQFHIHVVWIWWITPLCMLMRHWTDRPTVAVLALLTEKKLLHHFPPFLLPSSFLFWQLDFHRRQPCHWCRKTDTCWEGREPPIMTSQGQWLAQSFDEAISMTKPISGRIWNEETKRSNARRKTTIEVNLIISTDLTRCHSKHTQLYPIA